MATPPAGSWRELLTSSGETPPNPKTVAFVGAGPGAPDLLTVRALERISNADVLIWADSLVAPAIADLAPADCERIPTRSLTLEAVTALMLNRVAMGNRVVRLHDGDPSLYGAVHEQICRLADANVAAEMVPGISAYQATAAALTKELTVPGVVQTVVITRAAGRTGLAGRETLSRAAALGASLCLYLSAHHVREVQDELLHHYPPTTPVAIGFRVSWPDEQLLVVPLEQMASTSAAYNFTRTTLYVVSPALAASANSRSCLYHPGHQHLFRGATRGGSPPGQRAQTVAEVPAVP